ncbi:hypothetical protein [Caulobacter sp. 3R27C2-B]|uniref:winged helix domain-containing protein n=1 Tax=Caulobacter sp. 3R27C2-B TaxID=2502219 RepID=UPI0010F8FE6C|nr:hypothetical protein [Caulobacter sp. 3R27C2-B]
MTNETKNPADRCSGLGGAGADFLDSEQQHHTTACRAKKPKLWVRIGTEGPDLLVEGREAQTLALLLTKGAAGFTSGEASPLAWARRTSAYVHKLRRVGVPIGLDWEQTPDGSRVGRYFLSGPVALLEGGA